MNVYAKHVKKVLTLHVHNITFFLSVVKKKIRKSRTFQKIEIGNERMTIRYIAPDGHFSYGNNFTNDKICFCPCLAGMAGLEPTNARVKVWCLTDLATSQR